jgi:hypothetical protein
MKSYKPPISTDDSARRAPVRYKTRDSASPTRIEQRPPDEEAQRYADVIAQVRERLQHEGSKKPPTTSR